MISLSDIISLEKGGSGTFISPSFICVGVVVTKKQQKKEKELSHLSEIPLKSSSEWEGEDDPVSRSKEEVWLKFE